MKTPKLLGYDVQPQRVLVVMRSATYSKNTKNVKQTALCHYKNNILSMQVRRLT